MVTVQAAYMLIQTVGKLFQFYSFLVLIYCILSWIPMRQGGFLQDVGYVIARFVEPYLGLFRRLMPPMGGIDFSPVIAIIALNIIEQLLVRLLVRLV